MCVVAHLLVSRCRVMFLFGYYFDHHQRRPPSVVFDAIVSVLTRLQENIVKLSEWMAMVLGLCG